MINTSEHKQAEGEVGDSEGLEKHLHVYEMITFTFVHLQSILQKLRIARYKKDRIPNC